MTKRAREKAIKAAYVAAADELHGRDGECEVDDNAKVSMGADPGAYVQAWVWVYDSDMVKHLPPELRKEFEAEHPEEDM